MGEWDAMSHQREEGLDSRLVLARENFSLDLSLQVEPGEVVALIGPNGAGKTTVLNLLAGLLRLPATGRHFIARRSPEPLSDHSHPHVQLERHVWGDGRPSVRLDDHVWDDPATGRFVPTEKRPVGMVFQSYLLFPHLSALDNVAFGLQARGMRRAQARRESHEWLERVGVAAHATAQPAALSGGQAQRVALARALVTRPRLLLLDEPLAALDASTRLEVRTELAHHLRDFDGCAVTVTHDPLDAMSLADRIVVVENGRQVQQGRPAQVARAPRTDYVARLVGLNLVRGRAEGTVVQVAGGGQIHLAEPADGPVMVSFPPSAVALHRHAPHGSARNTWPGRIAGLEQHAHTVRVVVEAERQPVIIADLTPGAVAELDLALGAPVWLSFKATETHVYPD